MQFVAGHDRQFERPLGCFAKGSVNGNGKISSSRENTRSTDQVSSE